MSYRSRSLILNPTFARAIMPFPLVVGDIGARAGLVEPWGAIDQKFPRALSVVGFEPDAVECGKLNSKGGSSRWFFPYALWDVESDIDLHLAKTPSASSIHPPNWDVLGAYEPVHGDPRRTDRTVSVPAITLDVLAEREGFDIDFLKIDTQGAEFEIIEGGQETISRSVFGCTCENWNVEVHAGQKSVVEVIGRMQDLGFRVFDLERSALWRRDCPELRADRPELVGVDVLFFRDPDWVMENYGDGKLFKAALIADIWGFRGLAFELLGALSARQGGLSSVADQARWVMRGQWFERLPLPRKIDNLLGRLAEKVFGAAPKYPPIH